MADQNQTHELVSDVLFEDHLVDMWPQYPCLYDVRSSDLKNRDSREKALEEIAEKLGQTGTEIVPSFIKVNDIFDKGLFSLGLFGNISIPL